MGRASRAHGFDCRVADGRLGDGVPPASRSPIGTQGLLEDFQRALPDFRSQDNVGSAYCVRRYVVDKQLGGPDRTCRRSAGAGEARYPPDSGFRPEPRGTGPSVGHCPSQTISFKAICDDAEE